MADQKDKSPKKIIGGTVSDYLVWRGDLTFEQSPWNEIDAVIATIIAYANLGENELVFGSGRTLRLSGLAETDVLERYPQEGIGDGARIRNQFLTDLAQSRRFRDVCVLDQVNDVDESRNIQFSAMTLDVPGVGIVIAFRGTNPSVVGWKEDFMMSYVTPVPAQTAALDYLKKVAENSTGSMYLTGHSKGGNLAVYAAAKAERTVQDRLLMVFSFDGPGLDDETIASEGYRHVEPLIRSYVPSDSIVGMLMNYYPKYCVVQSNSFSILQHDPFNWKLAGNHFLEAEKVSNTSQILDQTIHEWLKSCTAEQREIFVTVVFSLLNKKQTDDGMLKKADEDASRMIQMMVSRLIAIHAGISWETNILKPLLHASDSLRQKMKMIQGNMDKSSVIQIDNHGNGYREAAEETQKMANEGGLSHKECLRLTLFTEEILSMASIVSGDMKADFWIERVGRQYELHVSTQSVLDKKQRRQMKKMLASQRTAFNSGFLAKLRGAFEQAMVSDSDRVCFALPSEGDRETSAQWDGYEHSILYRLADDVQVSIIGGEVRMTVRKEFTE